jgi:hypothetical protein
MVLATLVLATLAALSITQRLKANGSLVLGIHQTDRFVPGERCAKLSFYLNRSETVSVAVEDSAGELVTWLLRARIVRARERTTVYWSGRRTPSGLAIPSGTYWFRLVLGSDRHTVQMPTPMHLLPRSTSRPRISRQRYLRSCNVT